MTAPLVAPLRRRNLWMQGAGRSGANKGDDADRGPASKRCSHVVHLFTIAGACPEVENASMVGSSADAVEGPHHLLPDYSRRLAMIGQGLP